MTTQPLKLVKPERGWQQEIVFAFAVISIWLSIYCLTVENSEQLLLSHWPITLIAMAAAMFANATAVGGGFIFLPLFSLYYGISSIESLKLALATQAFGMSSGAMSWPGKLIQWRVLGIACAGAGIGMALGTYALMPPERMINTAFGIVSLLIGCLLILETLCISYRQAPQQRLSRQMPAVFFIVCIAGGLVNAWVSIGIGEVVALWMLFKWRFNIAQSVATGVAALAFCSILGFAMHTQLGGIPWLYLSFTAPGVILGGRLGARLGLLLAAIEKTEASGFTGSRLKALVAAVIFIDGVVVLMYAG